LKTRKLDPSKFDFFSFYFLIPLLWIGVALFFGIYGVANAFLESSWRLFFDAIPPFIIVAIVIGITIVILNRIRRSLVELFLKHVEQRPRLLFCQKISSIAMTASLLLYWVPVALLIFFPTFKTLPVDIKRVGDELFSLTATIVLLLFLFGFSMFLRFNTKKTVVYSLEYLVKIPDQDLRTFSHTRLMEFFSKDIVDKSHQLFLANWKFTQEINLWPEFNVIFLGLLCGNEKENADTKTFLGKLIENIESAEDAESYRRIAESLSGFKKEMKSISELEDETMLKGNSAIRKPLQERIGRHEGLITIFLTVVAIVVSFLLTIFK
jgi:hypothetical protein